MFDIDINDIDFFWLWRVVCSFNKYSTVSVETKYSETETVWLIINYYYIIWNNRKKKFPSWMWMLVPWMWNQKKKKGELYLVSNTSNTTLTDYSPRFFYPVPPSVPALTRATRNSDWIKLKQSDWFVTFKPPGYFFF